MSSKQLDQFLADERDGVFYLGHASILVRLNGKKILFDPVAEEHPYGGHWTFYPPQIQDERLLDVDAVVVSHMHQDHFDPWFLARLPEKVPIVIADGRPELLGMVKRGVRRIHVLPTDVRIETFMGLSWYCIGHESNGVDASMIVKNQNLSVYHGNDNFCSREALEKAKNTMSPVDIGFLPFAYIHWYPFLLEGVEEGWKAEEAERLNQKYAMMFLEAALALDVTIAVPFGGNLIHRSSPTSPMNQGVWSPLDLKKFCKGWKDCEIAPLFAADSIILRKKDTMDITIHSRSIESHLQGLAESLLADPYQESFNPAEISYVCEEEQFDWLTALIKDWDRTDHRIYIECSGTSHPRVEVDLAKAEASWHRGIPKAPYHCFKLDPPVFAQWVRGQISFEEVIGTRRFTVRREPNQYDPGILRLINTKL